MAERKTRTRKATPAERHAARALGLVEPDEVEVDATPTGEIHAARVTALPVSRKPAGMATSEWFARRARGEDGPDAA